MKGHIYSKLEVTDSFFEIKEVNVQILVFIIFLNELLVNEALLCEITSVKKLVTRTILNPTNQSSLLS